MVPAEAEKEIVVLSNKATRLLEESVKSTKEIALLKAETVKLEKEISEIKKTKSVVLQSVSTIFSDPQSMDYLLEARIQQTRLSPPIRHRNHGVHICLGAGIAYNLFIMRSNEKMRRQIEQIKEKTDGQ
jgi:hypothetical protein